MAWYRDRFLLWLAILLVGLLVLPFRFIGSSLVLIGEKIQWIDERILKTRLVISLDHFAELHEMDTMKRNARKQKGE